MKLNNAVLLLAAASVSTAAFIPSSNETDIEKRQACQHSANSAPGASCHPHSKPQNDDPQPQDKAEGPGCTLFPMPHDNGKKRWAWSLCDKRNKNDKSGILKSGEWNKDSPVDWCWLAPIHAQNTPVACLDGDGPPPSLDGYTCIGYSRWPTKPVQHYYGGCGQKLGNPTAPQVSDQI